MFPYSRVVIVALVCRFVACELRTLFFLPRWKRFLFCLSFLWWECQIDSETLRTRNANKVNVIPSMDGGVSGLLSSNKRSRNGIK